MIKIVEHGGHVNGLDVEDVTDQEEPVDAASARRVDDTFIDNPTTPFGDVPCQLLKALTRPHKPGIVAHCTGGLHQHIIDQNP